MKNSFVSPNQSLSNLSSAMGARKSYVPINTQNRYLNRVKSREKVSSMIKERMRSNDSNLSESRNFKIASFTQEQIQKSQAVQKETLQKLENKQLSNTRSQTSMK